MTTSSKPVVARTPDGKSIRYQTEAELGEGAGGKVFRALRLPDDEDAGADEARRVAIKLSHKPVWKGHLADEARILCELQSRSDELVKTTNSGLYRPVRIRSGAKPYEVKDTFDYALIELEYLDGETLRDWMDKRWRTRDDLESNIVADVVLQTARELAEGIAQLQGSEIIHRDLKPENIMRTSRGLRLFDFNVAKEDSEATKTRHVGTAGYIAPEVEAGRIYDARVDLYSVGVILWEIASRRRFEQPTHTLLKEGKLHLRWPLSSFEPWPAEDRKVLDELLPMLIVDASFRYSSAGELLRKVRELEHERNKVREKADPLNKHDMISLLSELRPSGLVSVVTDTSGKVPDQALQDFLRDRMQVEDPLEEWLAEELATVATSDRRLPSLFVLAGNAGDGKSHLMYRLLRKRLVAKPEALDNIKSIADATQSLSPTSSQEDRLRDFFAPFSDTPPVDASAAVHVIAMNTGMIIRFFEGEAQREQFAALYRELQIQLGLRRPGPEEAAPPWPVQVVNLDLRNLLPASGEGQPGASFVERMLDRLDPGADQSIPGSKWSECKRCSAFRLCPVAFNLQALRQDTPRRALLWGLRRVALDTDVHLSPRNMWGFLYRLVTGGVERYDVDGRESGDGPCDVVRGRVDAEDGAWLLSGHFTELLFQNVGAGTPWGGLARHDPAFSSAPEIDHLHTRLSVKTELDNEPGLIEALGGEGRRLAGLALDALSAKLPQGASFKGCRRDAAVRRQVFFDPELFDAWVKHDGPGDFSGILGAYAKYSRSANAPKLSADDQAALKRLREVVQEVFLHGSGRTVDGNTYLRVSQPNVRAQSELLVRANRSALDGHFSIRSIVVPDVHIVAHAKRSHLLVLLGYAPDQVTLNITGVRLTVDLALFEFLSRVKNGQKPSVRDMSQFQALLFIGERIGNDLARSQEASDVFVWQGEEGTLHRLSTDDFGQPHIERIST